MSIDRRPSDRRRPATSPASPARLRLSAAMESRKGRSVTTTGAGLRLLAARHPRVGSAPRRPEGYPLGQRFAGPIAIVEASFESLGDRMAVVDRLNSEPELAVSDRVLPLVVFIDARDA